MANAAPQGPSRGLPQAEFDDQTIAISNQTNHPMPLI